MFPMLVASIGPAMTGCLVASAVRRLDRPFLFNAELEGGVERHELKAGTAVDFIFRNFAECDIHHAVVAAVALLEGGVDQFFVFKKSVQHAFAGGSEIDSKITFQNVLRVTIRACRINKAAYLAK